MSNQAPKRIDVSPLNQLMEEARIDCKETADYLGLSYSAVRAWVAEGTMPTWMRLAIKGLEQTLGLTKIPDRKSVIIAGDGVEIDKVVSFAGHLKLGVLELDGL